MISIHSKKDDSIISSEKLCHSMHGDPRIDQFFRWILLAVSHCKIMGAVRHPLHRSSSITQGTLWVRELRSNCEELELNWCFLLRILLPHFQSRELQRYHKQAGCYISPGHHDADTKLQIPVCFSSNFLAIIVL